MRRSPLGVRDTCAAATNVYLEAKQCSGAPITMRVFIAATLVDACYTLPFGPGPCFNVYPTISRLWSAAEVAALGHGSGTVADPTILVRNDIGPGGELSGRGKTCCNCQSSTCDQVPASFYWTGDCTGGPSNPQQVTAPYPPCCASEKRRVTVDYTRTGITQDSGNPLDNGSHVVVGHGVTEYDGNGDYASWRGQETTTSTDSFGVATVTVVTGVIASGPPSQPDLEPYLAAGCPDSRSGPTFSISSRFSQTASCFSATGTYVQNFQERYGANLEFTQTFTENDSMTMTIESLGPCGGGCDGSQPGSLLIAVPDDEWPVWARLASLVSIPTDTGVGDTIRRTIGDDTSEAFQAFYKSVTGNDCNCNGRKDRWNLLYPY